MINRMKQGLGQARPNKKLSHGTVLVLYVFLKGLKEPR